MRRPGDPDHPSLSVVRDDDDLLQLLAERRELPSGLDDQAVALLASWATAVDEDLPTDLLPETGWEPSSRRTVMVTRAGVAASIAVVVLSGGAVAAAATEGGFAAFLHKAERAVEAGVAAPRPADPVVLASLTPSPTESERASTRTALDLARERLAEGDTEGAGAIVALVEDQVRHDPQALDAGTRSMLDSVRQELRSRPVVDAAGRSTPGRTSPGGTTSTVSPTTSRQPTPSTPGALAGGPRRTPSPRQDPATDGRTTRPSEPSRTQPPRDVTTPAPAPTPTQRPSETLTTPPTTSVRPPAPTDLPTATATARPTDERPEPSPTATRTGRRPRPTVSATRTRQVRPRRTPVPVPTAISTVVRPGPQP